MPSKHLGQFLVELIIYILIIFMVINVMSPHQPPLFCCASTSKIKKLSLLRLPELSGDTAASGLSTGEPYCLQFLPANPLLCQSRPVLPANRF